jgi:hypothetical protein
MAWMLLMVNFRRAWKQAPLKRRVSSIVLIILVVVHGHGSIPLVGQVDVLAHHRRRLSCARHVRPRGVAEQRGAEQGAAICRQDALVFGAADHRRLRRGPEAVVIEPLP